MSRIVKKAAILAFPFIMLFGTMLLVSGETSPGGGLAGGVVIASGLILQVIAFGRREAPENKDAGIALYVAIAGFVSIVCSSMFGAAAHIITNIALGMLVAASLALSFTLLSSFGAESEGK